MKNSDKNKDIKISLSKKKLNAFKKALNPFFNSSPIHGVSINSTLPVIETGGGGEFPERSNQEDNRKSEKINVDFLDIKKSIDSLSKKFDAIKPGTTINNFVRDNTSKHITNREILNNINSVVNNKYHTKSSSDFLNNISKFNKKVNLNVVSNHQHDTLLNGYIENNKNYQNTTNFIKKLNNTTNHSTDTKTDNNTTNHSTDTKTDNNTTNHSTDTKTDNNTTNHSTDTKTDNNTTSNTAHTVFNNSINDLSKSMETNSSLSKEFTDNIVNKNTGTKYVSISDFGGDVSSINPMTILSNPNNSKLIKSISSKSHILTNIKNILSNSDNKDKNMIEHINTNRDLVFLADGGIVNKPTMAMLGEGGKAEAVIPKTEYDSLKKTEINKNKQNSEEDLKKATRDNKVLKDMIDTNNGKNKEENNAASIPIPIPSSRPTSNGSNGPLAMPPLPSRVTTEIPKWRTLIS